MWTPRRPSTSDGSAKGQEESAMSAAKVKNPGRRFAQIVKLKAEHVDEYKKVHAAVWPEVLKQIKDCKMEDYSIYLDDSTHILFACFKYVGYDFDGDMERMRENERVREWWRMTDSWQESLVPGAVSSEAGSPAWWKPVEEVFHVD